MKFTEGGFRDWGYQIAQEEFGAELLDGGPWCIMTNPILELKSQLRMLLLMLCSNEF